MGHLKCHISRIRRIESFGLRVSDLVDIDPGRSAMSEGRTATDGVEYSNHDDCRFKREAEDICGEHDQGLEAQKFARRNNSRLLRTHQGQRCGNLELPEDGVLILFAG
jgi:hypothetical protein